MINRVLLYNSGGGIGDTIQILPLFITLKNELKNTKFYYLSAHENHFNSTLKDLNCEIESLNLKIKYFGFRWWHALIVKKRVKMQNIESFDLILDLQSKIRNSLILKIIPHKKFISSSFNFKLSKPNLSIKKENKIAETILKAINILFEKNYQITEYNINKIHKKFHSESEKLLPNKNYVGLSITQGNVYRKKEWPLDNIIKISNKLLETYKKEKKEFIKETIIKLKLKEDSITKEQRKEINKIVKKKYKEPEKIYINAYNGANFDHYMIVNKMLKRGLKFNHFCFGRLCRLDSQIIYNIFCYIIQKSSKRNKVFFKFFSRIVSDT